jgi:hypothetical protein
MLEALRNFFGELFIPAMYGLAWSMVMILLIWVAVSVGVEEWRGRKSFK